MRLILLAAFAALAGLFWVASGGAEFDPPERAATPQREAAPVPVAAPAPLTQAEAAPEPEVGSAEIAAFDRAAAEAEAEGAPAATAAPEPVAEEASAADGVTAALAEALDLRTVDGSVVNVREGPGTEFGIVGQLAEGQRAEVLFERDGWAEVRAEDGTTGWMAARFLR